MLQFTKKKSFFFSFSLDINLQAPLIDLSTCFTDFETWLEKYRIEQETNHEENSTWNDLFDLNLTGVPDDIMKEGIVGDENINGKPNFMVMESNVRSVSPASALASHDYADNSGLLIRKTFEVR